MQELDILNPDDKKKLLQAPAYISMLAANADGIMDEEEKFEAIKFSHIKTYSANKNLKLFYQEAEKYFVENIDLINKALPKDRIERENIIQNELQKINSIVAKLDLFYSNDLIKSLKEYGDHVLKTHKNIIGSFVIPLLIKGLTDKS